MALYIASLLRMILGKDRIVDATGQTWLVIEKSNCFASPFLRDSDVVLLLVTESLNRAKLIGFFRLEGIKDCWGKPVPELYHRDAFISFTEKRSVKELEPGDEFVWPPPVPGFGSRYIRIEPAISGGRVYYAVSLSDDPDSRKGTLAFPDKEAEKEVVLMKLAPIYSGEISRATNPSKEGQTKKEERS
ncbi:MAG: hypothetical protein NTY61_01650 [Candidatus Parcubacteria bacterium]|nr:hypothetical protein [Candidatus Parcubacteria bacterium]